MIIRLTAATSLVAGLIGFQYGWPANKDTKETTTVIANVVRFEASITQTTNQADLVVKTDSGKYVRLRYSPFDFGWDAPAAKPNQMITEEMVRVVSLVWKF